MPILTHYRLQQLQAHQHELKQQWGVDNPHDLARYRALNKQFESL